MVSKRSKDDLVLRSILSIIIKLLLSCFLCILFLIGMVSKQSRIELFHVSEQISHKRRVQLFVDFGHLCYSSFRGVGKVGSLLNYMWLGTAFPNGLQKETEEK